MDLLLLMGAKSVRKVIKKPIGSELSGVDFHLMRDKAKESVGPGVPVVSTEWVRECLVSCHHTKSFDAWLKYTFPAPGSLPSGRLLGRQER